MLYNTSRLMTWPKNSNCLRSLWFISSLGFSILCKTSSFDILAVQRISSDRLQFHIYNVSSPPPSTTNSITTSAIGSGGRGGCAEEEGEGFGRKKGRVWEGGRGGQPSTTNSITTSAIGGGGRGVCGEEEKEGFGRKKGMVWGGGMG